MIMTEASTPVEEYPGIKNHYIPRFHLDKFRLTGDSLHALNKHTGKVEPRSVENAGQYTDFYPKRLEDGIYRKLDDAVAQIFRYTLYKDEFNFTEGQRNTIAEWLFLYVIRTPITLLMCNKIVQDWESDPSDTLNDLEKNIDDIIRVVKQTMPQRYELLAQENGEQNVRSALLSSLRAQIIAGEHHKSVSKTLFVRLPEPSKYGAYVERLLNANWTWLISDDDFVIGDNPLCRWDVKNNRPVLGVFLDNMEVTIPLTRKITLWLNVHYDEIPYVDKCNQTMAKEMNRRQVIAAVQFVYASSAAAFR